MILDQLENSDMYSGLSENLKKGFDFLKNTDLNSLSVGKYEIDGMNVFALVSEYQSKEHKDCRLEAHLTYSDIQYIVSGKEHIGYTPLNNQEVLTAFNQEKDIVFYTGVSNPILVEAGMFAVFFPQDVHRPCMQIDGPEPVKKVVIKLKM